MIHRVYFFLSNGFLNQNINDAAVFCMHTDGAAIFFGAH